MSRDTRGDRTQEVVGSIPISATTRNDFPQQQLSQAGPTRPSPPFGARFHSPTGIAADSRGNVVIADSYNHAIRFADSNFNVTTLAGSVPAWGSSDGTGTSARFYAPDGIGVDSAGNVFVADSASTIRKITSAGVVTTFAGKANVPGSDDGFGSAARFRDPNGIAIDAGDNLYVTDTWNHTIRKITPSGLVRTIAGSPGAAGNADGTGAQARFRSPWGIAVDASGRLYVADFGNHAIRTITPGGVVQTLAGSGSEGATDGTGRSASFREPCGVAVDSAGNVYVADYGNDLIRRITPAGVVTTVAGAEGWWGAEDGIGGAAHFSNPQGIAVGLDGTILIADTCNHTIRRMTPGGVVTTVAGGPEASGNVNGSMRDARFFSPSDVEVDRSGRIFIADALNHAIRMTVTPPRIQTFTHAGVNQERGILDAQLERRGCDVCRNRPRHRKRAAVRLANRHAGGHHDLHAHSRGGGRFEYRDNDRIASRFTEACGRAALKRSRGALRRISLLARIKGECPCVSLP